MTENLKPCPFCGGTNLYITRETEDREGVPSQITCESCGANGPMEYIEDPDLLDDLQYVSAKTGWNGRVIALKSQSKPQEIALQGEDSRDIFTLSLPDGHTLEVSGGTVTKDDGILYSENLQISPISPNRIIIRKTVY